VRRAGDRVLVDPDGRREEAGDEVELRRGRSRGDDHPAHGEPAQRGDIGAQAAHGRFALYLHQVVEDVHADVGGARTQGCGQAGRRLDQCRGRGREVQLDPTVSLGGGQQAAQGVEAGRLSGLQRH
jgi:hypothetical protein